MRRSLGAWTATCRTAPGGNPAILMENKMTRCITITIHCPCKIEIMEQHLNYVRERARRELGFEIGEIDLAVGSDPGDDEPDKNGNLLVARFIHSKPGHPYHASTAWTAYPPQHHSRSFDEGWMKHPADPGED